MHKLATLLLLALVVAHQPRASAQSELRAVATLKDPSGATVGTVELIQEGDAVHVVGSFMNLPAGAHGFHIHAVGQCSPDFAAAGGHFNPAGRQHGLENPQGPHAGDLANLTIGSDGRGSYDHKTGLVTLRNGEPHSLFDTDGSALVVHASADDYQTDPTGNSGGRIACGVITMVQPPAATAVPTSAPVATPLPLPETGVAPQPAALPNTSSAASSTLFPLLLAGLALAGAGLALRRRMTR